MSNLIHNTRNYSYHKQTSVLLGDASDNSEESSDGSENESEENDKPVLLHDNPKNVPIGWDGKPIPYWLYKLHGLGV